MEKLLKRLTLLLVTATCLTFAACGDDKEEPDGPVPQPSSTEYEIFSETVGLESYISPSFRNVYGNNISFCRIYFRASSNLTIYNDQRSGPDIRFTNYGSVSRLQAINNLKDLSWVSVKAWNNPESSPYGEKNGYILEFTANGRVYYLRLFIDSFNRNASGDPIGVNVQYQQFIPSGL